MDVLIHISQQLSNSTTPAYTPTEFTVPPSIAAVNVLFFLSLALVLIDAFLAMLVKSWLQEFDRGWRKYTVANLRAQEREQRLRGLERWKLAELVTLLPILIQASLLFFCIGLLVLLFPIHLLSAILFSIALVAGFTFYVFTTYVSVFDAYAPFSSPVSRGLVILMNALQMTLVTFARNFQNMISGFSLHTSCPLPSQEPEANSTPSQPLTGNSRVTDPLLPHGNVVIKQQKPLFRSHSQLNPQTYAGILDRLVTSTAEAVENIPVFLELLDQPVKDPTLLPFNVGNWKHLLHMTLGLLGEPSTFPDSAARTIARTLLFCYDRSEPADEQLSRRLGNYFHHMGIAQTDKYKPLNSLFASYIDNYCGFTTPDSFRVHEIIVSLEPSNAADLELLWMINTIHKSPQWTSPAPHSLDYGEFLEFFAAVLTYVSSTEQSRRSQVPLTAAIIYAMHSIKSALDTDGIRSMDRPYVLPGTILIPSESRVMAFHHSDPLDLWSDQCVELASALLQPHTQWPHPWPGNIWKCQLALIAALYIDSTKSTGRASTAFVHLLKLTNIPDITVNTWGWAGVYDQTKLGCYWYMALFQEPIFPKMSDLPDIGFVIQQILKHHSEIRLSALYMLDISVKHICAIAPSSTLLMRHTHRDYISWDTPRVRFGLAHGPFNPWTLLHLDTLFSPSSIIRPFELEQLEWADTPEQVHIAKARLALYDSLQKEECQGAEHLKPEPQFLKMILWSKDYVVCTSAFKCCLDLAAVDQPSPTGDIHSTGMFIPEAMGCQWINHLIQVFCGSYDYYIVGSWKFLNDHLVPIWATLPHSWCHDFASEFLLSGVHPYNKPAYQRFTHALRHRTGEIQNNMAFLPFIEAMLELTQHTLNQVQLTSLKTWLVALPETFENHDAHVKLENILATREQHLVDETLTFFSELPMANE